MTMQVPIPKGYQQLVGLAGVQALIVPVGANFAMIRCTGADVRWRDDGQNPTAAIGYPLAVGDELLYDATTGLAVLRFIQQSPAAEISVVYYGV